MQDNKNQRGRRAFFGKAPSGVAELQQSELVEEVKQSAPVQLPKIATLMSKRIRSVYQSEDQKDYSAIAKGGSYGISIDGNVIPAFQFRTIAAAANAMTSLSSKSWNAERVVKVVDLYSYERQINRH